MYFCLKPYPLIVVYNFVIQLVKALLPALGLFDEKIGSKLSDYFFQRVLNSRMVVGFIFGPCQWGGNHIGRDVG